MSTDDIAGRIEPMLRGMTEELMREVVSRGLVSLFEGVLLLSLVGLGVAAAWKYGSKADPDDFVTLMGVSLVIALACTLCGFTLIFNGISAIVAPGMTLLSEVTP